jgi:hypothetical protein
MLPFNFERREKQRNLQIETSGQMYAFPYLFVYYVHMYDRVSDHYQGSIHGSDSTREDLSIDG